MKSIEKLSDFLKIFNEYSGEYLNFVGDKNKIDVALDGIIKINDFDNGVMGNVLEYEISLANFLVNQLDLSQNKGDYLDFISETYYDMTRNVGESDLDFYERILSSIFSIKCSPLVIYNKIKDLGVNVRLQEGINYGAFCDVSYCDNITFFQLPAVNIVKEAFCGASNGLPFFFIVYVDTITPANYIIMNNICESFRAAGIRYRIIITQQQQNISGFFGVTYFGYDTLNLAVNPVVTVDFLGGS
jgi:hypothetical protein